MPKLYHPKKCLLWGYYCHKDWVISEQEWIRNISLSTPTLHSLYILFYYSCLFILFLDTHTHTHPEFKQGNEHNTGFQATHRSRVGSHNGDNGCPSPRIHCSQRLGRMACGLVSPFFTPSLPDFRLTLTQATVTAVRS